jgi:predicted outer membrane repeat protein
MGLGGNSGDAGGIADGGTPTDGATATPVVCNTTIPGGSLAAANWTLAGSPYCIEGTVRVSLLTVEPGVEIFVDGAFAIEILTSLTAIGTEASPIRFSARSPAVPDNQRWQGLKFADVPPGSNLSYAIVEYANASGLTLANSAALATLDHCTFRYNSTTASGGAINATGALSNLTLTNCIFSQNSASTSGGAISATGGSSLTLTNCIFSQNSATTNGGAISATDVPSNLTLTNCTFSQNSASMNGGALSIAMAKGYALTLARSLFGSNTANPTHAAGNCMGGALYFSAGDVVISDCEFRGNRANSQCSSANSNTFDCSVAARGGAIWVGGTSAAVTRSLFMNNQTDALNQGNCFFGGSGLSQGAGLYVNAGTVTSKNNIWGCNTATATAGCGPAPAGTGIYVGGGAVNVTNDTVARNSSTGVDRAAGTLAVRNSILYANNSNGAQVGGTGTTPDGGVPYVTIAYSDVQGGYTGDGNTGFNPAFSGASCESSDLALLAGSPAIDTGDPDSALNDGCTPPGLGTARNDMGAFGGPANCGWQ